MMAESKARTNGRHFLRVGAADNLLVLTVGSVIVLAALAAALVWNFRHGQTRSGAESTDELFVFCAAGLRYAMDEIVDEYQKECGQSIRVQYGGSNTLLSNLEAGRMGDLFLPGDDSYIQLARDKGLLDESIPVAKMQVVVAVRKDSDLQIETIEDLVAPAVRLACGNPDAAASGRLTRRSLTESGDWESVKSHMTVFKPTVNEVANDVKLGAVDAGIVWDSTIAQYPELKAIRLSELMTNTASVHVGVMSWSRQPTAALRFARFVAARDRGMATFSKLGFTVVEGDVWEEEPEMTFFAGSVNRRALDPIIDAFQDREGVTVNTVYNGCGILTGQMKSIIRDQSSGFPDAYMACDVYYLDVVRDWFQDDVKVSDTAIVIVVQEGNPKGISTLSDLLKPGVRVAIGQPEQCTIGVLTRELLQHAGIYDKLCETNVVTQTATSALLVPAVTTGSADAVLAYRTDTLSEGDKVDVVRIDSKLAKAIQPYSIARSSERKQLAHRLFRAIARSRKSFESVGFHWRLDEETSGPTSYSDSESVTQP